MDVPIQGGPGGGPVRLQCPPNYFMLGVAMRAGAWVDAIRANCVRFDANRRRFIGPPQFTRFAGGPGGGFTQNGCSEDRYVAGIKIGFTRDSNRPKYLDYIELECAVVSGYGGETKVCLHTGNGCWDRHPSPGPYNGFGLSFTLRCPANQAAVGLSGRSGAYVDALGLVCGPKPRLTSVPPPPPPPPAVASIGQMIVNYAISHLGQCVADTNGTIRPGECGPPEGIAPGECTHLVHSALVARGGRPPIYNATPSVTPIIWGNLIQRPFQPGDIIQFTNVRLEGPNGAAWETTSQHSAIIEVVKAGGILGLLQQHAPRRTVTRGDVDLGWRLVRGRIDVYRPIHN
jgi:hypothetical protein